MAMRRFFITVLVLCPLLVGCGSTKPEPKPPAAALATAKQFLAAIKNKSPRDYCATFLPSVRYGAVSDYNQSSCLQLAAAWMSGTPSRGGHSIDAGEIKFAGDYLGQLKHAPFELSRSGRLTFHFRNGGQLVLEQEQVQDNSKRMAWKVDVDASGFTGP